MFDVFAFISHQSWLDGVGDVGYCKIQHTYHTMPAGPPNAATNKLHVPEHWFTTVDDLAVECGKHIIHHKYHSQFYQCTHADTNFLRGACHLKLANGSYNPKIIGLLNDGTSELVGTKRRSMKIKT